MTPEHLRKMVKPLVWYETAFGFAADTGLGRYLVESKSRYYARLWSEERCTDISRHTKADAAKAACERHHQDQVLAMIDMGGLWQPIDALRDCLRFVDAAAGEGLAVEGLDADDLICALWEHLDIDPADESWVTDFDFFALPTPPQG